MPAAIADRIRARAEAAGLDASAFANRLGVYVDLLARWNRRINLTALPVDPVTDPALDRLIVEPLLAARWAEPADGRVIDIGSGGGSPALPLKIAVPDLRLRLVESRVRKSAFLREAIRVLGLRDATVETRRFGDKPNDASDADVITVRAVHLDSVLLDAIATSLPAGGRLIWFTDQDRLDHDAFRRIGRAVLPGSADGTLLILEKIGI
jgi:16S rRNA (guanine527-N7)-methyltransferase